MADITYNITDQATGMVRAVQGMLRSGALENAMGAGVRNLIRDRFRGLNETRANKLGGARTNFWAGAARETNYKSKPGEFTVDINQVGFRQRLEGGTIRPTGGRKYLTIPAAKESYGKRASEFGGIRRAGQVGAKFNDLVVLFGRRGPYALAEAVATKISTGKRGNKNKGVTGGRVLFWLKKEVTQKADPTVLPSEGEILGAAIRAGELAVQAAAAKGAR